MQDIWLKPADEGGIQWMALYLYSLFNGACN